MDAKNVFQTIVGVLNGPEPRDVHIPLAILDQEEVDNILANIISGIVCGSGSQSRFLNLHKLNDQSDDSNTSCVHLAYVVVGDELRIKIPVLPLGDIAAIWDYFPRYRVGSESYIRDSKLLFSQLHNLDFELLLSRYKCFLGCDRTICISVCVHGSVPLGSLTPLFGNPVN